MLLIFASWLIWFSVFSGIGLDIRRCFGPRTIGLDMLLICFWIGWSCAILLLQVWHLWYRISELTQIPLAILGVCGLFWNRSELWVLVRYKLAQEKWLLVIMLIMALWLANRAIGPVIDYDTGLYHLPSIQWVALYPIVPGLGNLSGPLAHNSSFFLYAALLNAGWWSQKSQFIANSLLIFVLFVHVLFNLAKIISGRRNILAYYYALLLPAVLVLTLGDYLPGADQPVYVRIASLSPDASIFALGILVTGCALSFLIGPEQTEIEQRYHLFCIVVLSSVGITIKLNYAFLGAPVLGVVVAVWLSRCLRRAKHEYRPTLLMIPLASGALLLPWMMRGVILSGYPMYPTTFGAFNVDWRVPRALVMSEMNWIRSWSRQPRVFWTEVLGNNDWLGPWWEHFPPANVVKLAIFMFIFALFCRYILQIKYSRARLGWLPLIPAAVSIVLWFISAPNARYAGAAFWILAAGITAITVDGLVDRVRIRIQAVPLLPLIFCVIFLTYTFPFHGPLWIIPDQQSEDGLYPLPQMPYRSIPTKSGLVVNVPTVDDRCWTIPLPCTPHFRPSMRLREPGDIGAGFVLDQKTGFADIYGSGRPSGINASPELGVALPSGWYDFEAKNKIRWMKNPGKILLYSEQDTFVRLSLKPFLMNTDQTLGRTGQLTVTVNADPAIVIPVTAGVSDHIVLRLLSGFNIVKLELVAGNILPKDRGPKSKDTRTLSIAFYPIRIVAMKIPASP